jgi:tetratricopeptide (TPR) repeat protein
MTELSLQEYSKLISERIDEGRHAEAAAHAKHILSDYPKYVTAYRLLGEALLEAGQDESAMEMFHRVLGADPENLLAWVGLSEIHNRQGNLDTAIWHMERASELESDNTVIEDQLRHLYGRRSGAEPRRVQLTRGALARLYLKGDLLSRAISELHKLIGQEPDRVDLRVALAEALWRNNQRLEASELCQEILDELPYCLKANLLLGEIWSSSGRDEAQLYLRRAAALDPQNRMAQELFGSASILAPREVRLPLLDYQPSTTEEHPRWMEEMEVELEEQPEREAEAVDQVAAGMEAQIEIPSWLEEVSEPEGRPTGESEEEPAFSDRIRDTSAESEIPVWLTSLDLEEMGIEEMEHEEAEGEYAGWFADLELEDEQIPTYTGSTDELEPWPDETLEPEEQEYAPEEAPVPEATTPGPLEAREGDNVLAWLEQLADRGTIRAEEGPEWTPADLPEEAPGTVEAAPAPQTELQAELPPEAEGVGALTPEPELESALPAEAEGVEVPVLADEQALLPSQLEGEDLPSGEETLARLEQLSAGREEEVQAWPAAEEEPMAPIPGRAVSEEEAAEEALPPEVEPEIVEAAVVEATLPAEELTPEPGMPMEAVPELEEKPPEAVGPEALGEEVPLPAWLMGEGLPSGEEALAWLEQLAAGKDEEWQARVAAEAELRTAEDLGRRPATEGQPTEGELPPEAPEPEAEQVFGWTSFAPAEIPPSVEEPLPVEQIASEEVTPDVGEEIPEARIVAESPPSSEEEAEELAASVGEGDELAERAHEEMEIPVAIAPEPEELERVEIEAVIAEPAEVEEEVLEIAEEIVSTEPGTAEPMEVAWTEIVEIEASAQEQPEVEFEAAEAGVAEVSVPEALQEVAAAEGVMMEAPEPEEAIAEGETVTAAVEGERVVEDEAAVPAGGPPPEFATERAEAVLEPVGEEQVETVQPEELREAAPAGPVGEPLLDAIAGKRAHLEGNPRDYRTWLALARDLRSSGAHEEALDAYGHAMRTRKLVSEVIADLKDQVQAQPDVAAQRLLGDAYMKAGLLEEALETYRQALRSL